MRNIKSKIKNIFRKSLGSKSPIGLLEPKLILRKYSIILFYLFRHPRKFWHALSKKTKLRSAGIFFAVMIIAIGTIWLTSKGTQAAWWNDLWQYRKPIAVTNSSGSTLTDFQVKILDNKDLSADITAGKIQADLDDLRFTDINGKILPYWIEDNTAASVDVWIKVPTVHTTGTTVYMYYGNPSVAGLSNGKNTFVYFDDFNDNSLDTTLWTKVDSPAEIAETGGKLVFTGGASGSWDQSVYLNTAIIRSDMAIQFDYQWTSNNTSYDAFMFGWKDDGTGVSYTNLVYGYYNMSQDTCTTCPTYVYEDGGGGYTGNGSWIQNSNYKVRVRMRNSGGAYYDQSVDGGANWTNSYTSTYSTESNLHPAWMIHSGTHNVDNFFVRKDATTAPSAGTPATEEKGTAPVAYWSFDEGYGTTAYDETVNGNNGNFGVGLSAPTWKPESECVSGKCLAFDGSDDYLGVSDNSKLQVETGLFTVETWINPAIIREQAIIFKSKTDFSSNGWGLVMNRSGSSNLDFPKMGIVDQTVSYSFNSNTWYHIAAVQGSNSVEFFVNGKSIGTYSNASTIGSSSGYDLKIGGGHTYGGINKFLGKIDEPKIYNYARTAGQIKNDYVSGIAGMGKAKEGVGAAIGDRSDKWMTDGLVGYWKMDESKRSNPGTI